jgi:glyoxylase I family protein
MEKVTGIGGLFFRAYDPNALGRWYHQHLGISLTPSSEDSVW